VGLAREESYRDVLSLPLAVMFSSRVGRPDNTRGDEEPGQERAYKSKGAEPWGHYSGSEDSAEGGGVEGEEDQESPEVEGRQETPGMGTS